METAGHLLTPLKRNKKEFKKGPRYADLEVLHFEFCKN
jgi:hypothetical protein